MSGFKVGDKVRVIGKIDEGLSCEIGTIATVIAVIAVDTLGVGSDSFNIHIDWETDSCWVHELEIEKVAYTKVKQPKIKGLLTSATTSRIVLLVLSFMLLFSIILGGLHSLLSSILAVLTFTAAVNDEICRYEFKERTRYRKDVK